MIGNGKCFYRFYVRSVILYMLLHSLAYTFFKLTYIKIFLYLLLSKALCYYLQLLFQKRVTAMNTEYKTDNNFNLPTSSQMELK